MVAKKTLFGLTFAMVVTSAQASFELLLVADQNLNVVHRFDPVTGAYFGNFGSGIMSNIGHLAIDQSNNRAYVANYLNQSVQVWNYNTGEYLNEWTTAVAGCGYGFGMTRLTNGNIVVGGGSGVGVFSPTGALQYTTEVGSGGYAVGSDGTYLYTSTAGGIISKRTLAGAFISSIVTGVTNCYDITFRGTTAYLTGAGYPGKFGSFNTTTMSGFTQTTIGNLAAARTDSIVFSHGPLAYVSGSATGSGGPISRFNTLTGQATSTFGAGIVLSSGGMAIVVAPEPGGLIALGLGIMLLRRRK